MKRITQSLTLMFILCVIPCTAQRRASTTDDFLTNDQKPLRGLTGLILTAAIYDNEKALQGIVTRSEIEAHATAILKGVGLYTGPKKDIVMSPPLLVIELMPTQHDDTLFYSIEVRLTEDAVLVRKTSTDDAPDTVTVWATGTVQAINIKHARTAIIDTLKHGVELFVKDWQRANEKKKY